MTRIERQTAEAVTDLLAAVGFLLGNGMAASALRTHRLALSAALAADPAPAACDPYANVPMGPPPGTTVTYAAYDLLGRKIHISSAEPYNVQYDAEAPE